ncbi:MAG: SNF2-related protein [Sporichthyaceae bacterium]
MEGLAIAPGSVVVVRDEEWMVTAAEQRVAGWRVDVVGLSELVQDTYATFLEPLDRIELRDPRAAVLVPDDSPRHLRTRLWLEATLRRTPVPYGETALTVADGMLADSLQYQRRAVAHALSAANLRPRVLIADAVGLGKTLEIGMILAELARRGRADRILVVTPRHVLEQMQHELWCRFAIPLVRLDSDGLARVRQQLPASRNPFTFYRRIIVSIDTLKSPRYRSYLQAHRWDAVVIDESHNITNVATLNNELARTLAPNTEALILASATPHNGTKESFGELIRLLDPTAVGPDGDYDLTEVKRLYVRRHRHSDEVAAEVGAGWAKRPEPKVISITAGPREDAIAAELSQVWLYPDGESPVSGPGRRLFPWTLAKAFLSSPPALQETVRARRKSIGTPRPDQQREAAALERLATLADAALDAPSAKLDALVEHLRAIGVGPRSDVRAVLFAERIATLDWLRDRLPGLLNMAAEQFAVLHGTLPDKTQMQIVDEFKTAATPIRVLITGDVASEGVNLHSQCHNLVHVDIPWSLIRIEQRNGRIDRYGQKHPPLIAALALIPSDERFRGDVRVLSRLLAKEHLAHTTLGDAASLMGRHSVKLEEDELYDVLIRRRDLDEVVPDATALPIQAADGLGGFGAFFAAAAPELPPSPPSAPRLSVFASDAAYLADALTHCYDDPTRALIERGEGVERSGVGWRTYPDRGLVELAPPRDLRARLDALPQSYVSERRIKERLVLAVSEPVAADELRKAREANAGGSTWPEAHFLGPLHPVLDWISDKVLAASRRNEIPAVASTLTAPRVIVLGTLMNRRGQVVTRQFVAVDFPTGSPAHPLTDVHDDLGFLAGTGLLDGAANSGPITVTSQWQALIPAAVDAAHRALDLAEQGQRAALDARIAAWTGRVDDWRARAEQLEVIGTARARVERMGRGVSAEAEIAESLRARQRLVRPLLLVVPTPTAAEGGR